MNDPEDVVEQYSVLPQVIIGGALAIAVVYTLYSLVSGAGFSALFDGGLILFVGLIVGQIEMSIEKRIR